MTFQRPIVARRVSSYCFVCVFVSLFFFQFCYWHVIGGEVGTDAIKGEIQDAATSGSAVSNVSSS